MYCEKCLREGVHVEPKLSKTTNFESGRTIEEYVCPKCGHAQLVNYLHGNRMN